MAYSQALVLAGGIAHVPILITALKFADNKTLKLNQSQAAALALEKEKAAAAAAAAGLGLGWRTAADGGSRDKRDGAGAAAAHCRRGRVAAGATGGRREDCAGHRRLAAAGDVRRAAYHVHCRRRLALAYTFIIGVRT